MAKLFGKYRGEVQSDLDPLAIGRLLVSVPQLRKGVPGWAMPCLPPLGAQGAGWVLPPPGAGVWVEFEEGEIEKPIWTGCWYRTAAEAPPLLTQAEHEAPHLPDQEKTEFALRTRDGAVLSISSAGITLSNGQGAVLRMVGPTVSINDGALAVT